MKVLYVEDNPANVALVKRVARMGHHEIINFIDGDKAIAKFDEIAPDLVLMDIQLAGQKTGLDVVKHLRAQGVKTTIIAVTAYAMVGDKERALEAGCDDYLPKPLPIPRLVEIFKEHSDRVEREAKIATVSDLKAPETEIPKSDESQLTTETSELSQPVTHNIVKKDNVASEQQSDTDITPEASTTEETSEVAPAKSDVDTVQDTTTPKASEEDTLTNSPSKKVDKISDVSDTKLVETNDATSSLETIIKTNSEEKPILDVTPTPSTDDTNVTQDTSIVVDNSST